MNAVEIEEAVSKLAADPFDAETFSYAFLAAFGNKETAIKRLRSGSSNASDIAGGVLQRNKIHMAVCAAGRVGETLSALRASPKSTSNKVKFILATDGDDFQAEDLAGVDTVACTFKDFPNHFGFFLPLAGISTVRQISENAFDIRATSRLNKLYVELLKDNADWGTEQRRPDMNHFMARLIFCFFAEDTDIFRSVGLFTATVEQMSAKDSSNTHEVIAKIFRAMNTKPQERQAAQIKSWADGFPYVNGGLFSGSTETPRFSKIARTYLLHVGKLDWKKINPDIFGSMIQAVADDEERGALGMHYTSVPNILKVLNPLFLDELREQLEVADNSPQKLLNLRKRMARIRVFDPACGSGNFLVIAYKEMRAIEAEINKRRSELERRTEIPLTNFRGIELRDFPAEIARLALIIAEYQCDVLHRGQKEALAEFLPLDAQNWITCGNALRLDWISICPPTGRGVKLHSDDLFNTPLDQAQIDFENEGGETYICGNPPYSGSVNQTATQKSDIKAVFGTILNSYKDLDLVAAWVFKAGKYLCSTFGRAAFVSTKSICEGEQVSMLWPKFFELGHSILFAHLPFKWVNNASNNAGVICVIIGFGIDGKRQIFDADSRRDVENISPYLVAGSNEIVTKSSINISGRGKMVTDNLPSDGGGLIMSMEERDDLIKSSLESRKYIRRFAGSRDIINGLVRYCLWIDDDEAIEASSNDIILKRIRETKFARERSRGDQARNGITSPHRFVFISHRKGLAIAVPKVFSERREYMTCEIADESLILSDLTRVIYNADLIDFSILSSKLHLAWVSTICGKLGTSYRYSNTLGWNTFPVPALTEREKADLTRCAEDILMAREAHFPATIAALYNPEKMPKDVRLAHERNDEVVERIYIGRRFKNDTERLEKLFELYIRMVTELKTTKFKKARTSS